MVAKVCVFPESDLVPTNPNNNFASRSHRKTLQPADLVVDLVVDPTVKSGGHLHGSTEDVTTQDQQPKKRNFADLFDRSVFTRKAKTPIFTKFKRRKLNNNKPESAEKVVTKGRTNQTSWISTSLITTPHHACF